MIEQHLTGRELAEVLSVSEETVLRLAQRGELRSVRVGSQRRYAESAVDEYLKRHTEPVGSAMVSVRSDRR